MENSIDSAHYIPRLGDMTLDPVRDINSDSYCGCALSCTGCRGLSSATETLDRAGGRISKNEIENSFNPEETYLLSLAPDEG